MKKHFEEERTRGSCPTQHNTSTTENIKIAQRKHKLLFHGSSCRFNVAILISPETGYSVYSRRKRSHGEEGVRKEKGKVNGKHKKKQITYFELYLATALVPSAMACLASSAGSVRRTAV